MKLPPLPLPDLNNGTGWERTDAQVIDYGKACYLAALEEAAKVATATVCDTHLPTGVKIYGTRAGAAIRALKGKINE